jgi:hypothetical protein
MLSIRYKSRVRIRLQAIYTVALGTIFVTLSTLLGKLPGHDARIIKHALCGSPSAAVALRLIEIMAKRAGVHTITFDSYDTTTPENVKAIKF